MKTFENTINKVFTFSSCDICDSRCCDGKRGSTFAQIILSDFEEVCKNFPIAFLIGSLGYLKPVVLLSNGKDYCRYLQNNRCYIYEQRPSVCRVYPLSPHLTNAIFIDTLCPAVNDIGEKIIENNFPEENFKHDVLDSYQDKYVHMHMHFDKYNMIDNIEVLNKIGDIIFYKFKDNLDDKYIKMHLSSLKNFDEYFKG